MKRSPTLKSQVERYVAIRQQMGFNLHGVQRQLLNFAQFTERSGHRGPITVELAVRWARSSRSTRPITWARRLEIVRPFTKYCRQFEPSTEVAPTRLLGPAHRRLAPHIYTPKEIASLLAAAASLPPSDGLRPATYQTLFGLIAATGLRISEALGLTRADVDSDRALLTVRNTKFRKSRLVPLHPSTVWALRRYTDLRDRKFPLAHTDAFFVSDLGTPIAKSTVHTVFQKLRKRLRWMARGGHPAPRIHDLRHSFVCQALLRSYRQGSIDLDISALSTYLGHAKVTDTYWYVTGIPELMALAARRFERFAQGDSR